MEPLSAVLKPYKGTVGAVASVVTIGQFFSGALICKDIHRNKSTHGISSMPFVGGLVIGVLMLKYSLMLEDSAMFIVNLAAVILNILYIAFYNAYSSNKSGEIYKPSIYGLGLIVALFSYISWEQDDLVEYRFGLIMTVLMLLLMGSPLVEVNEIIKQKDASSIPFPITFMGAIVSFLWMLYGIILMNDFMVIQNVLGLILCIVQLALYWKYPKIDIVKDATKKLK